MIDRADFLAHICINVDYVVFRNPIRIFHASYHETSVLKDCICDHTVAIIGKDCSFEAH